LGWSYRRIAKELGVDRDTVSRHLKAAAEQQRASGGNDLSVARTDPSGAGPPDSNAAIVIAGSGPVALDPNAAIVIAGSPVPAEQVQSAGSPPAAAEGKALAAGRHSRCEPWRAVILQALEQGLTAKRIWQDLKTDHGFDGDYQ